MNDKKNEWRSFKTIFVETLSDFDYRTEVAVLRRQILEAPLNIIFIIRLFLLLLLKFILRNNIIYRVRQFSYLYNSLYLENLANINIERELLKSFLIRLDEGSESLGIICEILVLGPP